MSEVKEDTQPVPAQEPEIQPFYRYPGPKEPAPRQRGGVGCWIIGCITAFVVTGLVVVGLFLPPFNLGERLFGKQYVMLSSQNNAVQNSGLTLIVDPADAGTDFGVALDTVTMDDFLAGSRNAGEWIPLAMASVEPYLALQSPVYTFDTTGEAPQSITLTLELPSGAANLDVLDAYEWNAVTGRWQFVPSQFTEDRKILIRVEGVPGPLAIYQASPTAPIILSTLDRGQQMSSQISGLATIITPAGMQSALPTGNIRTLTGNPIGIPTAGSFAVMPVIRNFTDPRATDPDTIVALIGNRALRDEHVQELSAFTAAGNYDGIFIDYRDIPAEHRDTFTAFIQALAINLHSANLNLGVIVPPAENVAGGWQTGAYNWRALGQAADYVQINFGLDPTTFTPGSDRLVEAMLRWAVGEVNRYKLLGGLTARSIRQANGSFSTVSFDEALAGLGNVQLDVEQGQRVEPGREIRIRLDGFNALPGVDTAIQAPFIEYRGQDERLISRMWLTTGEVLRFRMDRMAQFGAAGVGFTDLFSGGITQDVYQTVANYKVQLPSNPGQGELALRWRVESVEGQITEFTTGLNEEIVVTLNAPDGNYAVNVDVVGGQASSSRRGAAVAVFAPTITLTPLPTNTPAPTPTVTPTLEAIVPTATPDPVLSVAEQPLEPQQAQVPSFGSIRPGGIGRVPGAGSISLSGFEYGGHVNEPRSERTVNAMHSAGMTWMKVQIRWGLGGSREQAARHIQAAHEAGFKILLGVVGVPSQLDSGRDVYVRQFADFLGAVAELGPDAIEVWNEPNLGREWPEGKIHGGNYTQLLREAYTTIKRVNPNVVVISGALAPTGAEAAFPGLVVNDDNFLRQMVASGAMEFMDCLGLHYNEGLVNPRATSGDPRGDNYYTRYLPTLLDVYWSITGGSKPICITELGYLTPEGYGQLPDFFAWAQNMTIQQQAAWLAEAAAYASNSGRVRLMIVWNVDFQFFGEDPMGGYAIIRPDGSCPACATLAGAR